MSAPHYLRAFGAGLGASVICSLIVQIVSLSFLYLFAGLIAGGVIAEVISRATSHKRGVGLQIVGGVCVFLGYLFGSLLVTTYRFGGLAWLALPASFLNPFYWIFPAIAAVVAVARLR